MKELKIKLKRCPFCGGKATLKHEMIQLRPWSFVECIDCNARTDMFESNIRESYDSQAMEAWNKRAFDVEVKK